MRAARGPGPGARIHLGATQTWTRCRPLRFQRHRCFDLMYSLLASARTTSSRSPTCAISSLPAAQMARQRLLELAPAYWKQTLEQPETQQKLLGGRGSLFTIGTVSVSLARATASSRAWRLRACRRPRRSGPSWRAAPRLPLRTGRSWRDQTPDRWTRSGTEPRRLGSVRRPGCFQQR